MDMFTKFIIKNRIGWLALVFCLLCIPHIFAQREIVIGDDKPATVVETEIHLDEITQPAAHSQTSSQDKVRTGVTPEDLTIDQQRIMMINNSLKSMIEENRQMIQEVEVLKRELGQLRGQSEIRVNRIGALTRQRSELEDKLDQLQEKQAQYEEEIKQMQQMLKEKEDQYQQKLEELRKQMETKEKETEKAIQEMLPRIQSDRMWKAENQKREELKEKAKQNLLDVERSTQKAISKLEIAKNENKQLVKETVKMRYNMGNLFFDRGDYERAAKEYRKVIEIMPNDASAHYNLAFVSSEFLEDYKTALEHYQQYLYLRPFAEDSLFVKEKILEAKLELKTVVDSPMDQ